MLKTEMRNPDTMHINEMSTTDMMRVMQAANKRAAESLDTELDNIGAAVDGISERMKKGGRLFYIGCGTSGRLGVLDASECPPTFGVSYDTVQGIIAGGNERMFRAGENAEDKYENGCEDIKSYGVSAGDVVVGISAAGNAAYVVGAIETAKALGCVTVGLTSNPDTAILNAADIKIFTDTGAEVLTGSTRLKAGTAQKIVLNAITTCAMTKTGKVYENMMINLAPSNEKLKRRVIRIVTEILHCTEDEAVARLEANEWNIRRAVDKN